MKTKNYIIVAHDLNLGIGSNNKLPWKLKGDMKFFKETTMGHCVIMGRNTYESIGRPLPNRLNIVLSRNKEFCRRLNEQKEVGAAVGVSNLNGALNLSCLYEKRFFIGGASIYNLALQTNLIDEMYITKIHQSFDVDTYFTPYNINNWNTEIIKSDIERGLSYTIFRLYK